MALASLAGVHFRLNPASIDWGYSIDTSVEETIGGRVVQVIGATLTDITLAGDYGERKGYRYGDGRKENALLTPGKDGPLLSWELAEAFLDRVRAMMDAQSEDSTTQGRMNDPLDFKFPEYGWHFGVYVRGIDDGQTALAINHTTGAYAYKWRISLFIVEERSSALVLPGKGTTEAEKRKAAAINGYISRISAGVGWKPSRFNQPAVLGTVNGVPPATQAVIKGGASA